MQAVADRGYFSGHEIKACTEAGITPLVPKPMTSNAKAEGRFSKARLHLHRRRTTSTSVRPASAPSTASAAMENGLTMRKYWASACPRCPLQDAVHHQRTTGASRAGSTKRILEAMQRRLDRKPEAMTLRRRTIEHVFGTLKHWMGATHFLTRGLQHVSTEMSLYVLAYNLKRVIKLLGMPKTLQAMRLLGA